VKHQSDDRALLSLLVEQQINPVLMEVGATGNPPKEWGRIASLSTYVGIGPEAQSSRRPRVLDNFNKPHLVEKVATTTDVGHVSLYVTKDTTYSSILKPDIRAASGFVDPDLTLERELFLPGGTVDAIVDELSLPGVDWLRTNINGVDVPIFKSLSEVIRRRILVVDTCLDLIETFAGQSSNIETYPEFVSEGFWPSRVFSYGPVKMRRETLASINALDDSIDQRFLSNHHRRAPGWLFIRFFRSIEFLAKNSLSSRDYLLLWTFAVLDEQIGFAADLVAAYQTRFGADLAFQRMQCETLRRFAGLRPTASLLTTCKKYVPGSFRKVVKRIWPKILSPTRSHTP
jgi:hypothetical protein